MIKSNGTVLHCNGGRTDGRAVFLCITGNFLRRRQDNTKKSCLHCWRSRVGAVRNGFKTEVESSSPPKGVRLPVKKEEEARRRFDEAQAQLNKPAWQKIHEQQDTRPSESEPLEITVEGLFRIAGILALLAGVIVFLNHAEEQTGIGLAYLIAGAFSCLGCFWCAKVIKLLSYANRLLLVIAKKHTQCY